MMNKRCTHSGKAIVLLGCFVLFCFRGGYCSALHSALHSAVMRMQVLHCTAPHRYCTVHTVLTSESNPRRAAPSQPCPVG